jgi:predicted phage tail protein
MLAIPPDIPLNLFATPLDGSVKLKWNKSNATDVVKYYIYMDTQPNASILVDSTTSATDTIKTITGLTNGQTYFFRVRTVDNVFRLLSGYSNERVAVPVVESGRALNLTSGQYLTCGSSRRPPL